MPFAVLAAGAVIFATGAGATDDPFLKRLAGDWTGSGSLRLAAEDPAQPVSCRVTATLDAAGVLRHGGRCALPDRGVSFAVDLRPAGTGKYAGTASAAGGMVKPVSFTGNGKSNQLVVVVVPEEGPPVTATLDAGTGTFRVKAERLDEKTGAKFTALDVRFGPS